jgi:hypothetical protein
MALDELARRFDLPVDSPEHIDLAETAWMGGAVLPWVAPRTEPISRV